MNFHSSVKKYLDLLEFSSCICKESTFSKLMRSGKWLPYLGLIFTKKEEKTKQKQKRKERIYETYTYSCFRLNFCAYECFHYSIYLQLNIKLSQQKNNKLLLLLLGVGEETITSCGHGSYSNSKKTKTKQNTTTTEDIWNVWINSYIWMFIILFKKKM